jgi:AcrR family transcriptional regulator
MRKPNAKDRILETASALFHERGFSEVGINEIIEKAETAKATFYQHFPSKESLCEAWLKFVHCRSEESRNDILLGEGSPMEKVEHYFDNLEEFMKDSEFRGCPYSNTGAVVNQGCCGIREQIESHKLSIRRFFQTLAKEIADSPERVDSLADTLFLLFSGATIESQNLRALWPIHSAKKAARESCERAALVTH